MHGTPLLSIVTPTRGSFSEYWFDQLCAVAGDVEFILVYPPATRAKPINDPRFKSITSPFKGEVFQRLIGLLNASGTYVLALDDDDYIHPQVSQLVHTYFSRFPESWCLRLHMRKIDFRATKDIQKEWDAIPDIEQMQVAARRKSNEAILQQVPIAPLGNRFDLRFLLGPYVKRKDMHGAHIENFNNKVWKTELVQPALADITSTMKLVHSLTWIPLWNLDRMLGLFIQAKFFERERIVGHWMPAPEQIRYISMDQSNKNEFRLMLPADALLAKKFPQYGYFWNLCFEQFWVAVKKLLKKIVTESMSLLQICPHPPPPSPNLGEGELD
ncbi:MAG: glycosyltransferase family A protein [Leptolyngbyaceae bacterium]|nr:glycosyltransferase family A protein [Leptolyngbyaceae bacterium]